MNARVVFDLDGTLIDSAPDIQAVANGVLQDMGGGQITLEQTHDFIGNGVDVFVTKMRSALGLPERLQAPMSAAFRERYVQTHALTRIYPGAVAVLEGLRDSGHALGLCTNKPTRATEAVLAYLELTRLFDTWVCGDTLPVRKPDPTPLHHAFADLAEGPQVYVGDSEVDAATAQALGVPFILFLPGYRNSAPEEIAHDAAFEDYADLPGIIGQLAR